jgi:hypothetical protein
MFEFITGFLSGLGVTTIVVSLIENKYHIVNKIRKFFAVRGNKDTDATLSLEYKSEENFEKICSKFKEVFRKDKDFKVVKKTDTKMIFQYGSFTINLIQNRQGNFFIETERIGSGIKGLRNKINFFLGYMREIEKSKIVSEFVGCDLTFSLPYKWDDMNIWTPKGLKIKKYNIGFSEEDFKSEVEISLNKVNIRSDTLQSINLLVEKFL